MRLHLPCMWRRSRGGHRGVRGAGVHAERQHIILAGEVFHAALQLFHTPLQFLVGVDEDVILRGDAVVAGAEFFIEAAELLGASVVAGVLLERVPELGAEVCACGLQLISFLLEPVCVCVKGRNI